MNDDLVCLAMDDSEELSVRTFLDWSPAPQVEPQPHLLPRNRRSTRQSEISRKRQAFITGMGRKPDASEIRARVEYLDDFRYRINEND